MNTGVTFNLLMRQSKCNEKDNILILEEAIMSDRHMSDGQISSFLQLFFNTKEKK